MRLSILSAALLPLLALADSTSSSTTTITSTATMTRTITVSEVVASVYATYPMQNSTSASVGPTVASVYPTTVATGTAVAGSQTGVATPSNTLPANYIGAGNSLNGKWVGGAGLVACVVAAML